MVVSPVPARDSRCGLVRTAAVADPTAHGCGAVRRSQLQPRGWSGLGGRAGGATVRQPVQALIPIPAHPNGAPPALTPRTVQPPRLRAPRLALPVPRYRCSVTVNSSNTLQSVTHGQAERPSTWACAGRPPARNELLNSGSRARFLPGGPDALDHSARSAYARTSPTGGSSKSVAANKDIAQVRAPLGPRSQGGAGHTLELLGARVDCHPLRC